MTNIVEFKRKVKPTKPDANQLLTLPSPEQIGGFISTLQYLIDLNQSDTMIIELDADGEFHIAVRGLQDYCETTDVISGVNLELNATGDLDFKDIPASVKTVQEMMKRVDLDNVPDVEET